MTGAYAESFARNHANGRRIESLYPGAAETVRALDRDGDLLDVATGESRHGLKATLEHHGLAERLVTLQTSDLVLGKLRPCAI